MRGIRRPTLAQNRAPQVEISVRRGFSRRLLCLLHAVSRCPLAGRMPDRLNHIGIPTLAFHQITVDGVAGQVPISRRIGAAIIPIPPITCCQPGQIGLDDPGSVARQIRVERRRRSWWRRTLPQLVNRPTNRNQSAQQNDEQAGNTHTCFSDSRNYNPTLRNTDCQTMIAKQ